LKFETSIENPIKELILNNIQEILPHDLQEGVLEAIAIQALGQVLVDQSLDLQMNEFSSSNPSI
jgi:hypothetical protein